MAGVDDIGGVAIEGMAPGGLDGGAGGDGDNIAKIMLLVIMLLKAGLFLILYLDAVVGFSPPLQTMSLEVTSCRGCLIQGLSSIGDGMWEVTIHNQRMDL